MYLPHLGTAKPEITFISEEIWSEVVQFQPTKTNTPSEADWDREVQREKRRRGYLVIMRRNKKATASKMKDSRLKDHKRRESIKFPRSAGMP